MCSAPDVPRRSIAHAFTRVRHEPLSSVEVAQTFKNTFPPCSHCRNRDPIFWPHYSGESRLAFAQYLNDVLLMSAYGRVLMHFVSHGVSV